jgi:phosphate-selective porin
MLDFARPREGVAMVFRSILAVACCLGWAAPASADQCAVNIGNGTSDILISVTVRAEFAPPGSEADRNLSVKIGGKLFKDQTAKVEWDCPTNRIRYIATGLFSNAITRHSAPFTPEPDLKGRLDTAWIE